MFLQELGIAFFLLQVLNAVPVHLLPQVIKKLYEASVVRRLEYHVVERFIRLPEFRNIRRSKDIPEMSRRVKQLLHPLRIDPVAGELHRQFLQRTAHLQHIPQILLCDLRHFRAFSRDHQNKALQLKFPDRFTDRRAAHPQLIGQLDLHQPLAGLQLPAKDRPPERIKHYISQGQVFIHSYFKIHGHLSPSSRCVYSSHRPVWPVIFPGYFSARSAPPPGSRTGRRPSVRCRSSWRRWRPPPASHV